VGGRLRFGENLTRSDFVAVGKTLPSAERVLAHAVLGELQISRKGGPGDDGKAGAELSLTRKDVSSRKPRDLGCNWRLREQQESN